MLKDLPLPTGSDPAEDLYAGGGRLINCFWEPLTDGKSGGQWQAVDGLVAFAEVEDVGGCRAMLELSDSDAYAVLGRVLVRLDGAGSATILGGIASDGMVTMARNRADPPVICIVCDGLVYYCQAGVLTQNTDPDLPPPISVTALDGIFSFLCQDGRHFASDVDAIDVNALSFATAEALPDPGVRNWTRGRDLVIGGTKSLEFWSNVGDDPYPFARVTSKDVGVLAPDSMAMIDETSAFVAHDGTVRILEGYTAKVISTREVERLIATDPNPSAITATSHFGRGKMFYTLSGTNWTREFNLATGKWHDRASYGMDRWQVAKVMQWGQRRLAGHYAEGLLYTLEHDAHDEAGEHLIMQQITPPVHEFPNRILHHALHVDAVPGVGAVVASTDPTYSPQLMIDWSDDGGRNWGTQLTRSFGRAGHMNSTIRLHRLGSAKSRRYRFSASAAVRRCVIAAKLDASMGGQN